MPLPLIALSVQHIGMRIDALAGVSTQLAAKPTRAFEVEEKCVILTLVLTQGGNVRRARARVHLSRMSQLAVRPSLASLPSD